MFRQYAIVSSADQRAAIEMIGREHAEKALSPHSASLREESERLGKKEVTTTVQ
jgi:hypothetical protein